MFNRRDDKPVTKVSNPLQATRSSMIEFNIGDLKGTGLYRFNKIIEMKFGDRTVTRYLIFSKSENTEYVFEVVPGNHGQLECYLFGLADTMPFSEDFLEIAGQKYLTTPNGNEYERCVMPEVDDRLEGNGGFSRIYNLETDEIEKEVEIITWDYQRDVDGRLEFLNIEMPQDTGMFRIFIGEIIEDIFFKFFQSTEQ